jgi:large subunit ribosomal protein L18
MALSKLLRRERIHMRIRKTVSGSTERPRLAVFRSNKEIYAQLVDDSKGITLLAASSVEKSLSDVKGSKVDLAKEVGKLIAKRAVEKGIDTCAFDRAGYLYHGRVKALAEGAREGGLKF